MVEELKKYFETTPREKVLENWAKSESFDKIGPTMDEFIKSTKMEISRELEVADNLDFDTELEFSITTYSDGIISTWLTMSELKTLADHLNNILDGN